ncbi:hypothetical protein HIM_05386 [Hirsutella minnesotensis 3608]|uniref:Alpha-type protein kinase domain-containing protein n=1 Tax=Hirsutella minnesotensis 3608 TaxID=1043627 RepID=A0A0F8A0B2_9HYPO|nr:hypothetical protein HIM_05386 [Hirsutella minnesotensis 3608]
MTMLTCVGCGRLLPYTSFTASEYTRGTGEARCARCVQGQIPLVRASRRADIGRYNPSASATVSPSDTHNPFAQGTFRWVAKGNYTSGPRQGEVCVVKWFKTGAVFSDEYFLLDIKAVDKTMDIVKSFNELRIANLPIKVNIPDVWVYGSGPPGAIIDGRKVLVEPFIENYQKFNSNTGWNDSSGDWGKIMQALSHFSYHSTNGNYVLCDLQGGIHSHEVVLSDPVILSRNREYGVTDLGAEGIANFFSQHVCNRFCRPEWTKPTTMVCTFRPAPGTTMIRR